jgi:hypothetical protein
MNKLNKISMPSDRLHSDPLSQNFSEFSQLDPFEDQDIGLLDRLFEYEAIVIPLSDYEREKKI